MAGQYVPIVITRTAVDSTAWTPLRAPQGCDYVGFYADAQTSVKLRTDPARAESEKRLLGGAQEVILAPTSQSWRDTRFVQDDAIYWIQTDGPDDVIVATWL